jgi:hypothetical protein
MSKERPISKLTSILIYSFVALFTILLIISFVQNNFTLETTQIVLIAVITILLLFRYFDVVEIPGFIQLSRRISEIKEETKEIKQNQMYLMQNMISQNASASNQVLINPIIKSVIRDAGEDAEIFLSRPPTVGEKDLSISSKDKNDAQKVINDNVQKGDYIQAFLEIRQYTACLLKNILRIDKNTQWSLGQLLKEAHTLNLIDWQLLESLATVRRVANIVIRINPNEQKDLLPSEVNKVIDLALRCIDELNRIKEKTNKN